MDTLFLGFDKMPSYPDGQVVELFYQNNVLKLTLKDYKEEIETYTFQNILQLTDENYLNEDIYEIRTFWEEKEEEKICKISILSAWTGREMIHFSFFM